jgi:hypothetical protein
MDDVQDAESAPRIKMEVQYSNNITETWYFYGYQITDGWMILHDQNSARVVGMIRLELVQSIMLSPGCVGFDLLLLQGLSNG